MTDLLDITLLVLGLFVTMSGLLYVLAVLDPQTQRPQPRQVPARQENLSQVV